MKIEVEIEDALLAKAEAAVDAPDRSALVSQALQSLIYRQAARELIALGGSDPNATLARRTD
ncbi:type II toxin-antitoxin system VapB family antitoxin [uncultured Sphingomonas sp.]|uniref:type II toxin-antitoxin system VapB family antitoxin n=1 Tax=uncultured Sphingomonas sp. TaxID=158754 RepID=UPI0035CC3533